MRIASIPLNEELRLQNLHLYDILDSVSEKEFDDLAELAAFVYGCPIAAITFIDKDRQWFKAKKGIDVPETSRDVAFCPHTILGDEVMMVKDASLDERFHDNPLVADGLCIRFYAGAPIVSPDGYKLGAVCVIDREPKKLTAEQTNALEIIAQQVSKLLELRRKNKLLKIKAEQLIEAEKKLTNRILIEQEKERLAIGTELHENIAQGLAATKLYLQMAEEEAVADAFLIKSRENVDRMLHEVRALSHSIVPTTLKDVSLTELLNALADRFSKIYGIDVAVAYQSVGLIRSDITMALYRIAEVQLQNVQQHANAHHVGIEVCMDESISLFIHDDGVGFDVREFQKGTGLGKIQSIAEQYNGTVDLHSNINSGCTLQVSIPLTDS